MEENKKILELAEKLNNIIKYKTQESEVTRWKETWIGFKERISYKIGQEKSRLKEFENDGFVVNKAITEGYILALESILTEMDYYGE